MFLRSIATYYYTVGLHAVITRASAVIIPNNCHGHDVFAVPSAIASAIKVIFFLSRLSCHVLQRCALLRVCYGPFTTALGGNADVQADPASALCITICYIFIVVLVGN